MMKETRQKKIKKLLELEQQRLEILQNLQKDVEKNPNLAIDFIAHENTVPVEV